MHTPVPLDRAGTKRNTKYKLFLRVHSAEKLQHASSQSTYCKVYVGETAVMHATYSTISSLFSNDNSSSKAKQHQMFHTKVCNSQEKTVAQWNEKFEIGIENPVKTIVSIRVKCQQPLICPSIGACAINLHTLQLRQLVDQNFPLYKNKQVAGSIRLQLMLTSASNQQEVPSRRETVAENNSRQNSVQPQHQPNAAYQRQSVQPTRDSDYQSVNPVKRESSVPPFGHNSHQNGQQSPQRRPSNNQSIGPTPNHFQTPVQPQKEYEYQRTNPVKRESIVPPIGPNSYPNGHQSPPSTNQPMERTSNYQPRGSTPNQYHASVMPTPVVAQHSRGLTTHQGEEHHSPIESRPSASIAPVLATPDSVPPRRRSTIEVSYNDILNGVSHNTLPSDSEEDDDSDADKADSDEERELLRKLAELQMKKNKKKSSRKTLDESVTTSAQEYTSASVIHKEVDVPAHQSNQYTDPFAEFPTPYPPHYYQNMNMEYNQQTNDLSWNSYPVPNDMRQPEYVYPDSGNQFEDDESNQMPTDRRQKGPGLTSEQMWNVASIAAKVCLGDGDITENITDCIEEAMSAEKEEAPAQQNGLSSEQMWNVASLATNVCFGTGDLTENIVDSIPDAVQTLAPLGKLFAHQLSKLSDKMINGKSTHEPPPVHSFQQPVVPVQTCQQPLPVQPAYQKPQPEVYFF